MIESLVFTIIVVSAVIGAVVAITVIIEVRENKYKKFVTLKSEAIKNLKELNSKKSFNSLKSSYVLFHRFDNKTAFNKTECSDFLVREVRSNYLGWDNLLKKIEQNVAKAKKYRNEVEKAYTPIDSQACFANKKNHKKCLKLEKNMFDSLIIQPTTSISVNVKLQYVSPQGRVNIKKEEVFSLIKLKRIFDSVFNVRLDRETYEKFVRAERGVLSDSMRYDVLRRDCFRCVLCGASASDGAILHVDHIVPVSKGGRTEMSNLRTLCERCNLGKSNKIE